MKHTITHTEIRFDKEFFVEGDCYQIFDKTTNRIFNGILYTYDIVLIEFIDRDGDIFAMTVDDYLTRFDVVKLYPDDRTSEIENNKEDNNNDPDNN